MTTLKSSYTAKNSELHIKKANPYFLKRRLFLQCTGAKNRISIIEFALIDVFSMCMQYT